MRSKLGSTATFIGTWAAVLILVLAEAPSVQASPGDDLLEKVEDTMTAAHDQVSTVKMTLIDSKGVRKERKLTMMQLKHDPDDYRLIRFLEPAEVKGVAFLSKSDTEMYLYMPAFKKIRRIASSAKNDNFMGTDFSYDDMGSTNYTDDYSARIIETKGDLTILELTPKKPDEVNYSKLVMTVDVPKAMPTRIEFYSKKGELWKVMTMSNIKKISGYWTPTESVMEDKHKHHTTKMEMLDVKYDTGLSTRAFSKRKLKRSR